jgi:hypothetical protein
LNGALSNGESYGIGNLQLRISVLQATPIGAEVNSNETFSFLPPIQITDDGITFYQSSIIRCMIEQEMERYGRILTTTLNSKVLRASFKFL